MTASQTDGRVDFALVVDGAELEPLVAGHVQLIEVSEAIGELARVRLVLRNWDAEANRTDDAVAKALPIGASLVVRLGYEADLVEVFNGLIVACTVKFDPGDLPSLEVRGTCKGLALMGASKYRVWMEQSDVDAIGQISKAVGLKAVGSGGPVHPLLVQHRLSDWAFIASRAAALGRQLYVRGDELNFAPAKADVPPEVTLEMGRSIMAVQISQDVTRTFGAAEARAWDSDRLKESAVSEVASPARRPVGKRATVDSLLASAKLDKARARIMAECIPMDQGELQAWAQASVDRGVTDTYYGKVKCAGDPKLRIDSCVEFVGLGDSFDGPHYVTRAKHRLSPGSLTTELGLGTPPAPVRGAPGEDARVMRPEMSLIVATVESFEDEDRKLGTVKVKYPWMDPKEPPVPARLASPSGGDKRGFLFVPEPDDEVLVQFIDGDPRHGVVVGSLWNGKSAPPAPYDPKKNDRRSLASRAGHLLVFHDGDETPGVSIETAAGQSLSIDDTSGSESVALKDKGGNEVRLDSNGIALTAASGNKVEIAAPGGEISLAANKVSMTADSEVKLEGRSAVGVKSAGNLDVMGSNVKVTGSAGVTAAAPLIKLN